MCTIGLSMAVYVLAYFPCIIYSLCVDNRGDMTKTSEVKWFGFAANYFLFVSSACNPFICLARTKRFRKAIKQLLKTPCGVSENIQVGPVKMETIKLKKAVANHNIPRLVRYVNSNVVSPAVDLCHSKNICHKATQ